jgi:hypothetical protein
VDGEASAKSFYGYPTVNSGPMDISKAKEVLGFSPTTTEEAVRQSVHFYEEAFYAFPNQRDEVLSELFTSAIPKVLLGLLKILRYCLWCRYKVSNHKIPNAQSS